jgi:hypothetical protein
MGDEVHYELRPEDATAMAAALGRPAWGARNWGRHERLRRVLAGMALGGLAFTLVKLYVRRETGLDLPPWENGLAAVGGFGFVGWMLGRRPAPLPADHPSLGGRSFAWWENGFRVSADHFRTEIEWVVVSEIREAGGYLLLITTWGEVHAVPMRALEAAGAANRVADIRASWERGRGRAV